jgi:ribosomal protein L37AE/L43A
MKDCPQTLMEFEHRFTSEEACKEHLSQLRWPNGFICPRCRHHEAWQTQRGLYHCSECDVQASLTAGTILQDTRKPLQLLFWAMWYVKNKKHVVLAEHVAVRITGAFSIIIFNRFFHARHN